MDAVKIGGIVFAGVAGYLLITKVAKAGGDIGKGASDAYHAVADPIVKKAHELAAYGDTVANGNPALDPSDPMSSPPGLERYWKSVKRFWGIGQPASNPSNVKLQGLALLSYGVVNDVPATDPLPATGAGGGQSSPDFAATDPRRLDLAGITGTQPFISSYVNNPLSFG